MTTHITPDDPIPLSALLFNKATDKYVQAVIVDQTGSQIAGSPVGMPHVLDGLYEEDGILFPSLAEHVTAIYTVYNDAGFTIPSNVHLSGSELFVRGEESMVDAITKAMVKALATQQIVVVVDQDIIRPVIVDQKC